jgi:glycosyltransferase involved in cell wall biosynthesis
LGEKTLVDNGLKDGLIRLSVTDRDPRRAAELANGWVEEYRLFSATLAVSEASGRRLFFEQQLSGAREDLAHAEDEMKQTQQRTGVIELDGQAHAMIASAAMLRAQVAAKQVEIQAMRQFAAEGNSDLERARQEMSSLEGQLSSMDVANDRPGGDLVAPKGNLSEAGLDYARALREVKYREMVVQLLVRQYEMARVDEARQGAQVQVVDVAVIPDRPVSRFRVWIVLGGLLLSLPVALLIALVTEAVSRLLNLIGRLRPDVLHMQEAINPWFSILASLRTLPPVVTTVHDVSRHPGENRGAWLLARTRKLMLCRSQAFIVHADVLKNALAKDWGVPKERVHVVPHGELGSFYLNINGSGEPSAPRDPRAVLFFGRILRYKGLDVLVSAMEIVRRSIPGARLIIAGRGDPISRYLPANSPRDQVEVIDRYIPDSEVGALFRRAGMLVLPYVEASQSGVACLAMATGTPIVASAMGGWRSLFATTSMGFWCRPRTRKRWRMRFLRS